MENQSSSEHQLNHIYTLYSLAPTSETPPNYSWPQQLPEENTNQELQRGDRVLTGMNDWQVSNFHRIIHDPTYLELNAPDLQLEPELLETSFLIFQRSYPILLLHTALQCDIRTLIMTTKTLYDPLSNITIGSIPMCSAASASSQPEVTDKYLSTLRLAAERHQIVCVSDSLWKSLCTSTDQPTASTVLQILFKDPDINHTAATEFIARPPALNSPTGTFVALWGGTTLIHGWSLQEEIGQRRIQEMQESAAQVLSGLNQVRVVSRSATRMLENIVDSDFHRDMDPEVLNESRERLVELSHRMSELEMELSIGAEILQSPLFVLGGRPIEEYHRELCRQTGFDLAVTSAAGVIRNISRIMATRRTIVESIEAKLIMEKQVEQSRRLADLSDTTTSVRAVGIVATTLLGVLSGTTTLLSLLGYLDSNQRTGSHTIFIGAAITGSIIVSSGLLGAVLYRLSKVEISHSNRQLLWRLVVILSLLALVCFIGELRYADGKFLILGATLMLIIAMLIAAAISRRE